jgi:hypothetical protein
MAPPPAATTRLEFSSGPPSRKDCGVFHPSSRNEARVSPDAPCSSRWRGRSTSCRRGWPCPGRRPTAPRPPAPRRSPPGAAAADVTQIVAFSMRARHKRCQKLQTHRIRHLQPRVPGGLRAAALVVREVGVVVRAEAGQVEDPAAPEGRHLAKGGTVTESDSND